MGSVKESLRHTRFGGSMLLRALLIWIVIIAVETIHGIVRRILLVPLVGESLSNQAGVFIGSGLIVVVVWTAYDWLAAYSLRAQLLIGALWCLLTFSFETGLGYSLGYSPDQILAGYDPWQGGLMLFGMVILLCSLLIVSRLRGR